MIILGINAYHGDAAACIVQDGEILAACEEERLRRIKHCAGFPKLAIEFCLKHAKTSLGEVEHIAISRDVKANLRKKMSYLIRHAGRLAELVRNRVGNAAKIIRLEDEIKKHYAWEKPLLAKIHSVEHHLAHMASAFFPSPFEEAAILSLDGFGDFLSAKWGMGKGSQFKTLGQVGFPHSMGVFYTAATQYLGFPHYGDEYKVMGMAAYGKPRYEKEMQEIVTSQPENGFFLNLDYFIHHSEGVEMNWEDGYPHLSPCYSPQWTKLFGTPRQKEDPFREFHYDLAASVQKRFEDIYFDLLNLIYRETRSENLCLAGGCAFNSLANGKIRENTPFKNIFIQPAAGDAGTALGAALYVEHMILGTSKRSQMKHAYLGPSFEDREIETLLKASDASYRPLPEKELIQKAARALADGKIVGWFQGRMEFGPRALGNRSLLADPRQANMKDKINARIKHREHFRPFAPSILEEAIPDFFEEGAADPFMTRVSRVRPEKRGLIPAVTHADGTGRLQAVSKETNPGYWQLITAFKEITGVPVLLNTSFNDNEPIVCTSEDAYRCFHRTGMDILVIGGFWVEQPLRPAGLPAQESSRIQAAAAP